MIAAQKELITMWDHKKPMLLARRRDTPAGHPPSKGDGKGGKDRSRSDAGKGGKDQNQSTDNIGKAHKTAHKSRQQHHM